MTAYPGWIPTKPCPYPFAAPSGFTLSTAYQYRKRCGWPAGSGTLNGIGVSRRSKPLAEYGNPDAFEDWEARLAAVKLPVTPEPIPVETVGPQTDQNTTPLEPHTVDAFQKPNAPGSFIGSPLSNTDPPPTPTGQEPKSPVITTKACILPQPYGMV